MKKVLLTSAGFENKQLELVFLRLAEKAPGDIRALFIPTAAVDDDARAVLRKCWYDLRNAGLPEKNIVIYDCDRRMEVQELAEYDAVYVCGGSPEYLLKKIYESEFDEALKQFVDSGGVYVGVSAGSWIAVENMEDGLGFVSCTIAVHQSEGTAPGPVDLSAHPHILLTNQQAILRTGGECTVIE